MNSSTLFRVAVIAEPITAILAGFQTALLTPMYSEDWQLLLAWSGDGGMFNNGEELHARDVILISLALAIFVIYLANQIGLFFYWKPSRLIYVFITATGFALAPFLGLTVAPPMEVFWTQLSALISGITLALLFFSPISDRFASN